MDRYLFAEAVLLEIATTVPLSDGEVGDARHREGVRDRKRKTKRVTNVGRK
jgi:hypothetical protein